MCHIGIVNRARWLYLGRYKHGKQHETLDIEVLKTIIETGHFCKESHRAFLILLYYTGMRKSEALRLMRMDFTLDKYGERIHVKHYPLKHGIQHTGFYLPYGLPFVNILREWLVKLKPAHKVFPFSTVTAWHIVKRVLPKHYPHYFRLNRCVKLLNKRELALDDVRTWFGWTSVKTIDNYLGYSTRTVEKVSEQLD